MTRILIVDDEKKLLGVLSRVLAVKGYEVEAATSGTEALAMLEDRPFDILVCDIQMTPVSGMDVLRSAIKTRPELPVIMCTAYSSVDTALESLKLGAFDYVTKPFNLTEFVEILERARLWKPDHPDQPARPPTINYGPADIVCESRAMRDLCSILRRIAPAKTCVLLRGEHGSGKRLAAQALHSMSPQRENTFAEVKCRQRDPIELEHEIFGYVAGAFEGADSDHDGVLSLAEGGTVWLDEIAAVPIAIQKRILYLLKNHAFRPAGVSQDLQPLIRDGVFLSELFARLAPLAQEIPPLRQRKDDILPLVAHFLKKYAEDQHESIWLEADVQGAFMHYNWPGNVKELEGVVQSALQALKGSEITRDLLPEQMISALEGRNRSGIKDEDSARGQAARRYLEAEKKALKGQVLNGNQAK